MKCDCCGRIVSVDLLETVMVGGAEGDFCPSCRFGDEPTHPMGRLDVWGDEETQPEVRQ